MMFFVPLINTLQSVKLWYLCFNQFKLNLALSSPFTPYPATRFSSTLILPLSVSLLTRMERQIIFLPHPHKKFRYSHFFSLILIQVSFSLSYFLSSFIMLSLSFKNTFFLLPFLSIFFLSSFFSSFHFLFQQQSLSHNFPIV